MRSHVDPDRVAREHRTRPNDRSPTQEGTSHVEERIDLEGMFDWEENSPLATLDPAAILREIRLEGPVTYLLAHGYRDDDSWGAVGAFWISMDRQRGGFLVHPEGLWTGSELARNYRNAIDRDWTHVGIFRYWQRQGFTGIELALDNEECTAASLRALWNLLNSI
jgi:hypothetical protein